MASLHRLQDMEITSFSVFRVFRVLPGFTYNKTEPRNAGKVGKHGTERREDAEETAPSHSTINSIRIFARTYCEFGSSGVSRKPNLR